MEDNLKNLQNQGIASGGIDGQAELSQLMVCAVPRPTFPPKEIEIKDLEISGHCGGH